MDYNNLSNKEINFKEQIALVKIKDGNINFGSFFGVKKFPVTFILDISADLLNVKPNYKYYLEMKVSSESNLSNPSSHEIIPFSIPEENMIFVHNNVGQSFITGNLALTVDKSDSFVIEINLLNNNKKDILSTHLTYFYFGEHY